MGLLAVIALLLLAACGRDQAATDATAEESRATSPLSAPHPQYVQVGPELGAIDTITNPYAGDELARAEGERLYQEYNCVSCHGGAGTGGIGPTLNDSRFKYGGSPAEIFQSIYIGRPNGMPVWGGRIPDAQIWKLVAYVQTLSAPDIATVRWPGIPAQAARTTPAR